VRGVYEADNPGGFMDLGERFENFTNGRRTSPPGLGFLRYLMGWTLTLAFVFSFTGGGNDSFLGFATRFGHWFIHVGTGLLVVSAVSALLQRGPSARLPFPLQLALYGLVGAIAFTPLAVLFETWLPVPGGPGGAPDWPMEAAREGWLRASLTEFGNLAPSFLGSWLLINLAYLVPDRAVTASVTPPEMAAVSTTTQADTTEASEPEAPDRTEASEPAAPDTTTPSSGNGLRARLPRALGADIIHLRADLNYLHVTTAGGSAMLLYSLARAAEELGEIGLMVHRAHWVASAHVVRTRRTGQGLVLTLSNGVDVPVSRRRQAEIRTRFGDRYLAPVTPGL
jgi:hypothetical protein